MLPLSVGVSTLNRVYEPEHSQHYNFSADHTRQWSTRNSKCGTLNYKVQESQVECWKGWRWIKWQSEKQHRWDDCQITGRLFSVCHSDKVVLSLLPRKSKEIKGSSEETGETFFPFSVSPLSSATKWAELSKKRRCCRKPQGQRAWDWQEGRGQF